MDESPKASNVAKQKEGSEREKIPLWAFGLVPLAIAGAMLLLAMHV